MAGEEFVFKFGADWQAFITSTQAALASVERQLSAAGFNQDASGLARGNKPLTTSQSSQLGELRQLLNLAKEIGTLADKAEQAPSALANRLVNAQRNAVNLAQFTNPNPATPEGSTAIQTLNQEAINRVQAQIQQAQNVFRDSRAIGNLTNEQTGGFGAGQKGFNDALAAAAVELQKQTALQKVATARWQRNDQEYLDAQTQATIEQRATAAALTRRLNQSLLSPELSPGGNARTVNQALNDEAANTVDARLLQADAQKREFSAIEKLTGGLEGYAQTIAEGAVSQRLVNATIKAEAAKQEAASAELTTALSEAAIANRTQKANVTKQNLSFLGTPEGTDLLGVEASNAAEQKKIQAQQVAAQNEILAGDEAYAKLVAQNAVDAREFNLKQQTIQDQILTKDKEYLTSISEASVAARKRAAKEAEAANAPFVNPTANSQASQVLNTEARNTISDQLQKAQAQVRLNTQISAGDGGFAGYAQAIAAGTVAEQTRTLRVKAATDALEAQNGPYINAIAASRFAEEKRKAATDAATAALIKSHPEVLVQEGETAAIAKGNAATKASAETKFLLNEQDQQTLKLQAEQIVLQKRLSVALQEHVKNEIQGAIGSGELSSGTTFQRLQAFIANRSGGTGGGSIPTDFQGLGQFLTSKTLTTAGFAASGLGFVALTTGITSAFSEANKFEVQLELIKEQLIQTDRAGEFPTLRTGLIAISEQTGVMADQLANVALQLQGAFGDQGSGFVLNQVKAAAELSRVTNEPLADTTNQLTAISKTFGVTFQQIGDTAVGLQQRLGVTAKEIIQFSGDLAPVAAQAGLSFQKLAAIGAVVQQLSGRSGAGLSEGLGRVITGIQNNGSAILSLYASNPKLTGFVDQIAKDLSSGDTGAILERLIRDFNLLSKAQQNLVASALGGNRQAPILNALFGGNKEITSALDGIEKGQTDSGKLAQQFKQVQDSLSQTLAELKATALQLGIALLNSGFIDFLKGAANGVKDLLQLLNPLITAFGDLVKVLGGAGGLGHAIELSGLLALLSVVKSVKSGGGVSGGLGVGGLLSGGLGQRVVGNVTGAGLLSQTPSNAQYYGGIATAGLGAAALIGGQQLGGPYGGIVSSIGAGLTVGAFNPVAGLVTAAVGSISAILQAGQQAKQKADALRQQYAQLATTDAGTQKLTDIVNQAGGVPTLTGLAASVENAPFYAPQSFLKPAVSIAQDLGIVDNPKNDPAYIAAQQLEKSQGQTFIDRLKFFRDALGKNDPERKKLTDAIKEAQANVGTDTPGQTGNALGQLEDTQSAFYKKIAKGQVNISLSQVSNAIKNAAKKADFQKLFNDAQEGDIPADAAQLQAQFDSGQIGLSALLSGLKKQADIAELVVKNGGASAKLLQQVITAQAAYSKAASKGIKDNLDEVEKISGLAGNPVSTTDVARYVQALQNPQFTDPTARGNVLNSAFAALHTILQNKINLTKDVQKQIQLATTGIPVPQVLQNEVINQQVQAGLASDPAIEQKILASFSGDQAAVDSMIAFAEIVIRETKDAPAKALIDLLEVQKKNLADQLKKIGQAAAAGASVNPADVTKRYNAALKAINQAEKDIQGNFALNQPTIQIPDVKEDPTQFFQALAAQNEAIAEAQINYAKQLVAKDPGAAAQKDIQLADQQAKYAASIGDKAGQINAATARLAAEQALQQAVFDLFNAQINYAIAVSTAGGDTVKAAQESLKLAETKLKQAQAQGAGPTTLTDLQSSVVTAQAALRDATLQESESTIDFNLQAKNISSQQAITEYQALLNQADILHLTEQQRRDLILKIKGLQQSLGADFQFNLPTQLALPTLYEVRRLNQSGGTSNVDNRQIVINLNANGASTAQMQDALNQVTAAVNTSPVFGSVPRRY